MDWSHIVELHGPTVWRISRRLLTNESDAADCFQQTFVSALELLRREPVANWGALLKRIAYSCRSFDPANLPRHYGREMDLSLVDPDGSNVVTVLTEKVDPRGDGIELVAWR